VHEPGNKETQEEHMVSATTNATQPIPANLLQNKATAADGSTSSASSSGSNSASNSATISANDFLTLLVTEMQNQDPTQATDPNQYINQLVSVNSLEQLISINQNLSTALGISGSTTPTGASTPTGANASATPAAQSSVPPATQSAAQALRPVASVTGNLGIPAASPAAQRVATALSGSIPAA
jgi:flagellar basal-body rod modification protein FlgD